VALKQAPIMAIKPTGEEVQIAEVVTPPPAQAEVAQAEVTTTPAPEAERMLPATASSFPMIALFGLLALGGALVLRRVEARIQ